MTSIWFFVSLLLFSAPLSDQAVLPDKEIFAKKKWTRYEAPDGHVRIKFPASFKKEVTENENGKTTKVSCEVEGMLYFFARTEHVKDLEDYEKLAEVSLDAFISQSKAEVQRKGNFTYKGHSGREADLLVAETRKARYQVILEGNNQYQLIAVSNGEEWDEKTAQKFLRSFKLK